jgi:hypothetical protein
MTHTCFFLDAAALSEAEAKRIALAGERDKDVAWKKAHNSAYGWASMTEVVAPCAMWFAPWLFDPKNPEHELRRFNTMKAIEKGTLNSNYLSIHYWNDWSDKRPPIICLTPNGREWCVDAKSNNGDGWSVTGEPPLITCSPSILVPGYHGFLREGVFTPNM